MNRAAFLIRIQAINQTSDTHALMQRVNVLMDNLVRDTLTDWAGAALRAMVDGSFSPRVADAALDQVVMQLCVDRTEAAQPQRPFAQRCLDAGRIDVLRALAIGGTPALLALPPVQLHHARNDAGRMLDLMAGAHTGIGCSFGMSLVSGNWSADVLRHAIALLLEVDPCHGDFARLESTQLVGLVHEARAERQAVSRAHRMVRPAHPLSAPASQIPRMAVAAVH